MNNSFCNMELKQFKELFSDGRQAALGGDFCIVDVRCDEEFLELQTPIRLDAYLLLICIKGRVRLCVNMKEFVMEEDQITLMIPGSIGQVISVEAAEREKLHCVMVGMSRHYLSTLHLDLNRLFSEGATLLDRPVVKLTEEEKSIAQRYLELGLVVLGSNVPNKRECLGLLISSIFYLSEGVFSDRLKLSRREALLRSDRAQDVFNKFLRLLADYHTQERSVAFYAGKLCLSPKYFSKLIKAASGRSAPEWIDLYVILEAKNYLKYSDMSIKEIVCRLHFSDQPTFTKFFKTHTGVTPARFRKN